MREKSPHLILLHSPSLYDFRKMKNIFGLIGGTIASSPIFEYFPIGFLSMMDFLERKGLSVRIVNLAVKMRAHSKFDVEKFIGRLDPMAFGFDLHWLVHAQGSLEVAKIVKRLHPQTKIIFGGLSASYYHRDLIKYPFVDYVLRGDSTEGPLLQLLRCIESGKSPHRVPNLTWKENDKIHTNSFSYLPEELNIMINYKRLLKSIFKYRDLRGNLLTGTRWPMKFASTLIASRGCLLRCVTCGGSNWALGRKKIGQRNPQTIAKEMDIISHFSPFDIVLYGDIRMGNSNGLLEAIRKKRIKNRVKYELFWGAKLEFLEKISSATPRFVISLSPESHDEGIRGFFGKRYSNESLEETIRNALRAGAAKVQLFFMIGLPHQTRKSVLQTIDYAEALLERFKKRYPQRIEPIIAPLEPFIDPGSPAFENPERYGYRLLFKSLEEHIEAIKSPSWKLMLNYETESMSREEIVDVSYEAVMKMKRLRLRFGLERKGPAERRIKELEKERKEVKNI